MIRISLVSLLVCVAALARAAHIAAVPLDYGITKLDLTGKGDDAMVVLARRENFNAHGFDVASIYVRTSSGPGAPAQNIVPVLRGTNERLELTAPGGADCLLRDFRLVRGEPGAAVALVVADRPLGSGHAEKNTVTFERYALRKNAHATPVGPRTISSARALRRASARIATSAKRSSRSSVSARI